MTKIAGFRSDKLIQTSDRIWIPIEKNEHYISYPDHHDFLVDIEESSFWFNHRNNCISKVVEEFSPKQTIFDVGGGNGYVAHGLMNSGNEVVLIEPGIKGAKNAINRGVKNVVCSTLQETGIDPESIPNIGIFDVLEHIENDKEFLSYLYQMLQKDGHLYITVPAYQFLWSAEDDDAGHFRRYTLKTISNVLKQAGFDIRFKSYIFFFLPLPVLLFRTLPMKLGIVKKEDAAIKEHNPSFVSKLINWVLAVENKFLLSGIVRFGGSCLIVAQKKAES